MPHWLKSPSRAAAALSSRNGRNRSAGVTTTRSRASVSVTALTAWTVPGGTTDLAVLGGDHALAAAQPEAHLALDHRPDLLLDRMQMRRQRATGLDPGVHHQAVLVVVVLHARSAPAKPDRGSREQGLSSREGPCATSVRDQAVWFKIQSRSGDPDQFRGCRAFPSDVLVDCRPTAGRGVREQLEQGLRAAIQDGRLHAGTTMPATRVLAGELGVSRSVVVEAYGNLTADGYLTARQGSGTRVRPAPDAPERAPRRRPADRSGSYERPYRMTPVAPGQLRLLGGLPDPALFPRTRWLRHYRAALAEVPDPALLYPGSMGASALRKQLAAYLGRVRGVATTPQRLMICTGYTQGLTLVCRALRRAGARRVAVEDPSFAMHRTAIEMTGLEVVPVPVDEGGIDLEALDRGPEVAAVVVAPGPLLPHRRDAGLGPPPGAGGVGPRPGRGGHRGRLRRGVPLRPHADRRAAGPGPRTGGAHRRGQQDPLPRAAAGLGGAAARAAGPGRTREAL